MRLPYAGCHVVFWKDIFYVIGSQLENSLSAYKLYIDSASDEDGTYMTLCSCYCNDLRLLGWNECICM